MNQATIEVRRPNYCFKVDLATARAGLHQRFHRCLGEIKSALGSNQEPLERAINSLTEAFNERFERFASDSQNEFREVLGIVNSAQSLRDHLDQGQ